MSLFRLVWESGDTRLWFNKATTWTTSPSVHFSLLFPQQIVSTQTPPRCPLQHSSPGPLLHSRPFLFSPNIPAHIYFCDPHSPPSSSVELVVMPPASLSTDVEMNAAQRQRTEHPKLPWQFYKVAHRMRCQTLWDEYLVKTAVTEEIVTKRLERSEALCSHQKLWITQKSYISA